jgi:hypothetical protein
MLLLEKPQPALWTKEGRTKAGQKKTDDFPGRQSADLPAAVRLTDMTMWFL